MAAGNFEASIKVLERYIELNDSIHDDQLSQEIIHEKYMLEAKQDSLSFAKEKELSYLLYEKKINDDKMLLEIEESRRNYLYLGLVFLVLLGGFILMVTTEREEIILQ